MVVVLGYKLLSRQDKIKTIYRDHDNVVEALSEILPLEEFVKLQEDIDTFEDKSHLVARKLMQAISTQQTSNPDQKDKLSEQSEAKILGIKLPEFHITKFDGDKLKWLAFKSVYIAVIHTRTDINDVVKFTFLLDSVKGKAAEIIGAINLTLEGYQSAWNNLMRVYDKPKAIAQANIVGIFNLPQCKNGSAEELRSLLNTLTSHLVSLTALDLLNQV